MSQNTIGNLFAIPFIEDEVFKVTIFNKNDIIQELDISEMIGLESGIRPIDSLIDPLINLVFIDESCIFVICFDHLQKTLWYFTYNIVQKQFKVDPQKMGITSTTLNFPIDSFYDSSRELVHVFFRQGQALSIAPTRVKYVQQHRITEYDLGEMQLYNNRILIVKSSEVIDLYQIEDEIEISNNLKFTKLDSAISTRMQTNKVSWNIYHTLDHKGFVQLTPLSNRFQIICDELIYFYEFKDNDNEPIPELKNTMQNFMMCNQMMIDAKERFCLTYKTGEPDLKVFMRKYDHGYIEKADQTSREGCSGTNI